MATRRKPQPPSAAKLARERARALIGPVPPGRVIPARPRKQKEREKHKPDWLRQAGEAPDPRL